MAEEPRSSGEKDQTPEPIIGKYLTFDQSLPEETVYMTFMTNSHGHYTEKRIERLREAGVVPYKTKGQRFIHAGYVTVPDSPSADVRAKSAEDIRFASEIANWMGFKGINVHLSRSYHLSPYFVEGYSACLSACVPPCELYFENTTGKLRANKSLVGRTPCDILSDTYKALSTLPNPRKVKWSFCLDTAHLFVQGQPLTTREDAEKTIEEIKAFPVGLVHLNGSMKPFGSGQDKHAVVMNFDDQIWSEDHSGLTTLLCHWAKERVPLILERPGETHLGEGLTEIESLRKLAKECSSLRT